MTIRYISDSGSDAGAGTIGDPYLTLVKAWTASSNGDEILIQTPGTWDGVEALFHSQAEPGDTIPNYSNSNHAPSGVTIGIDPSTPTGDATFQIPTLTGWGKNEQGGSPLAPLVAGHLWEWINPNTLTIEGEGRIILRDYEDAGSSYPGDGIKEAFSSALYFLMKAASGAFAGNIVTGHNSTVNGVLIGQYAGMGFHSNGVTGTLYIDCEASTEGEDAIGSSFGTVSGFRYNEFDGRRVGTTITDPTVRGDTHCTPATTTGMAVGDMFVLGTGRDREIRIITEIDTGVLTLGGWYKPRDVEGDVYLQELPLLYDHADNSQAMTVGGTNNCIARNNGRMGRNDTGSGLTNNDFGCEGIVLQKGTQRTASYHDRVHGCWARSGSRDYNTEGGAYTFYALLTNSQVIVNRAHMYDNHSPLEQGRDSGAFPGARDNGGWLVSECVVDGLADYNHMDTTYGNPTTAGAVTALLRANPNGIIRKCTIVTTTGANFGGFRWLWSNPVTSYGGPIDNCEVSECIFVPAYATNLYRFDASVATQYGSFPPGTKLDRNLFSRSAGSASTFAAIADFGANTTHAYSEAGRLTWVAKAASHGFAFSANDKWAVDPNQIFVDRVGRDYRLAENSPAKAMAEHGDDIGAIPQPNLVQPTSRLPKQGFWIFD